jgi:S1-C subfamily serine protease
MDDGRTCTSRRLLVGGSEARGWIMKGLWRARFLASVLALDLSGTLSAYADTVTGTGFAVTFDAIVITNHHVINECGPQTTALRQGRPLAQRERRPPQLLTSRHQHPYVLMHEDDPDAR